MTTTFDQIYNAHDAGEAHLVFGPTTGCPECHRTEGEVSINRQQVQYCATHQLYWLWSLSPYVRTAAQIEKGRKDWIALGLENMKQVRPWIAGQRVAA